MIAPHLLGTQNESGLGQRLPLFHLALGAEPAHQHVHLDGEPHVAAVARQLFGGVARNTSIFAVVAAGLPEAGGDPV